MVFDGYRIVREIHGSSRSHIYLGVDTETETLVAIKIPVDRPARRSGLSEAIHDGGMGRPADRQPPCAQAAPAVAEPQLSLCRDRIHRWADADAMDDRQSEAGPGNGARHRRADRQGPAGLSPQGNAASGPAAGQHHDRQDRNGEDHRFRLDQGRRRRRGVAADGPRRHSGHRAIHRAGIFSRRKRLAALRPVLARRHHLSDADGTTALRRADRQGEDQDRSSAS